MIPEWLKGFYIINRRYDELAKKWGWLDLDLKHRVESKYCKITEIVPGKEYKLGFEDMDQEFYDRLKIKLGWSPPDWDFDEPILHVTKINNSIYTTVEKYGGGYTSDIYFFDKVIFFQVGGVFGMNVGKSTKIGIPEEAIPAPPIPIPIPEVIKKWWPLLAIGGIMALKSKAGASGTTSTTKSLI